MSSIAQLIHRLWMRVGSGPRWVLPTAALALAALQYATAFLLASWAYDGARVGRGEHGLFIAHCFLLGTATTLVSLAAMYWTTRRAQSWWSSLVVLLTLVTLVAGSLGLGGGLLLL